VCFVSLYELIPLPFFLIFGKFIIIIYCVVIIVCYFYEFSLIYLFVYCARNINKHKYLRGILLPYLRDDAMQCCRYLPPVSCCLHNIVNMVPKIVRHCKPLPEESNPHNHFQDHTISRKMFEDLCSFAPVRRMFKLFLYSESLDVFSNIRWFLKLKVDVF
jgi:hypothetical protein